MLLVIARRIIRQDVELGDLAEQIIEIARQVQSIGRYMHDHSIKIGVRRT